MTKLYALLLSLTLTTLSVSCKVATDTLTPEGPIDVPTNEDPRPGKVCPVGTPLGDDTFVGTTIGPAGGKLTSTDLGLTINVPAGAVESTQTFSAEAITNTVPQGLGVGFRLAPHGITFKKPVTISVRYNPKNLSGTFPQALVMAYQSDKGIWRIPSTKRWVDTTAHTVNIETTHFSDWAVMQRVVLVPATTALKPGASVILHARGFPDELDIPYPGGVSGTDVDIPEPETVALVDETSWKHSGAGQLKPAITTATYTAPATPPARNPVSVSVKLKGPTVIDGNTVNEIWLVSNIYVADEGITYRINRGPWVKTSVLQGGQIQMTDAGRVFLMVGASPTSGITISDVNIPIPDGGMTEGVGGTYEQNWSKNVSGPKFLLSDNSAPYIYVNYYNIVEQTYDSPGSLVFSQFGKVGEPIIGTFLLEKAGRNRPGQKDDFSTTAVIDGFFRVTRTK
ncbi:hypothetical protein JYG30_20360 [Fibrella sp. USSR17]